MELVLDRRIMWDKTHLKQIDQAKKEYLKWKRKGYVITLEDKMTVIERFNPAFEEIVVLTRKVTKHVMKILNQEGDERIVWDKENGMEAKQAKERFLKLLKDGWLAYSVDRDGNKNRKITEFDVDAEEILMVPKTAKG